LHRLQPPLAINSAYQQIEEAVYPLAPAKAHVETAELELA
jgi:hypothetical protein